MANDIIYLATPYSHNDPKVMQDRFEKVTIVSGKLIKYGVLNFSPITQSHEQALRVDLPTDWDFWKIVDTEFLHRCDKLYVLALPGWQTSKGVTAEIEIMKELNKPISYLRLNRLNMIEYISEEVARRIV
jgi:hypothetical protein